MKKPECQLCVVRRQLAATRACMREDAERIPVLEAELARLKAASDAEIERVGLEADKEQWERLQREAFRMLRRRKGPKPTKRTRRTKAMTKDHPMYGWYQRQLRQRERLAAGTLPPPVCAGRRRH